MTVNGKISDSKTSAIMQLLTLIEGINKLLDLHEKAGNVLMIKQYLHQKKEFAQQLIGLLESEYHLSVQVREAA